MANKIWHPKLQETSNMFNQQGQEPDVFTVHAVKPSEFQHSVDFVSCDWLRQQYFAFFWHAARRQAWVQLCEALQSTLKGVWFVRWRYCEWIAEASQCNATITLVHAGGHIMRYLIGFIEYSYCRDLTMVASMPLCFGSVNLWHFDDLHWPSYRLSSIWLCLAKRAS